jgi:hypothetical protein
VAAAYLARPAIALERFDFEQRYLLEPGRKLTDHAFLARDGVFHVFYTRGYQGQDWTDPGNGINFGHATSTDLVHWTVQDSVLSTETPGWKESSLWAPHVVDEPAGESLLYFTGVDGDGAQQIGVALSGDLFTWFEPPINPVYQPDTTWAYWRPGQWANCRDPFVMASLGDYFMLATAMTKPGYQGNPDSLGAISLAFSDDGLTWSDVGAPLFINDSYRVLESNHMVERDGIWYLFFHEKHVPGIQYMTSDQPFAGWEKTSAELLEYEGVAAEIYEHEGQWWVTRWRDAIWGGETILGIKIDPLEWNGTTPVIGPQNVMLDDWMVVSGTAFDVQPTFGDRPFDRTGVPSNVEGHFWINSAELHAGPIVWGEPESPPNNGLTGIMRSREFTIGADYMVLRVGGGNDPERLYVALVDPSPPYEQLRVATGEDSDVMREVIWDLADLAGAAVKLEITDLSRDDPMGHINVDAILETDDPYSIGVGPAEPARLGPRPPVRVAPITPARGPVEFVVDLERSAASLVLELHDAQGRLVRRVDYGSRGAGRHLVVWDGRGEDGRRAARGGYFYRVPGAEGVAGKLVLVR